MYVVIELQTMADGTVTVATPIHSFCDPDKSAEQNRLAAEGYYHEVLAAATRSGLPCHSATILRNDAHQMAGQAYRNGDTTGK